MNSILIAAAVVMLLLLFLKVPVFISVLGALPFTSSLTRREPYRLCPAGHYRCGEYLPAGHPFFVCAGIMMNYTGVTARIMGFCEVLTGRMYGGLAQVNVLLSTLMGGLSGSNLADAAMEPRCWFPRWRRRASPRSSLLSLLLPRP